MKVTQRRWLIAFLVIALALRLIYGLTLDPLLPYQNRGGDSWWYLLNGFALVGGVSEATNAAQLSTLQPPPVYLIFVGIPQRLLPPAGAMILIRIVQALMSTATCYFAYRLARRIAGERAGLLSAAALAISPVFILESAQIASETVYIFWAALALFLYVEASDAPTALGRMAFAGAIFGLATLTRAVLLLFPLGLLIHLLLIHRPKEALKRGAMLLAVYALVVSTWTIYNLARWDRFVIAGEGFASLLYAGATGWDDPDQFDQRLMEDAGAPLTDGGAERQEQYVDATGNVILRDLGGYLQRRVGEVASAYLQPHGVTYFSGESLRELALHWLNGDRDLGGLLALIQGDYFILKFALYVIQYVVLIFGLFGMWRARHQWRWALPLVGFVAYVTLVHFALYVLPRYIFPTMWIWYIFAAVWWTLPHAAPKLRRARRCLRE